jgi:hypothetical protein
MSTLVEQSHKKEKKKEEGMPKGEKTKVGLISFHQFNLGMMIKRISGMNPLTFCHQNLLVQTLLLMGCFFLQMRRKRGERREERGERRQETGDRRQERGEGDNLVVNS